MNIINDIPGANHFSARYLISLTFRKTNYNGVISQPVGILDWGVGRWVRVNDNCSDSLRDIWYQSITLYPISSLGAQRWYF